MKKVLLLFMSFVFVASMNATSVLGSKKSFKRIPNVEQIVQRTTHSNAIRRAPMNINATNGDTVVVVSNFSYGIAYYSSNVWYFEMTYDDSNNPDLYLACVKDTVSKTSIEGTWYIYYATYVNGADSIETEWGELVGTLTVTYVEQGVYNFAGSFDAPNGITYSWNIQDLPVYASDADNDFAQIALTDGGVSPTPVGDEITVAEAEAIASALKDNEIPSTTYTIIGYVGTLYDSGDFYLVSEKGGRSDLQVYKPTVDRALTKGDYVQVVGKLHKYIPLSGKTTLEVVSATVTHIGDTPNPNTPNANNYKLNNPTDANGYIVLWDCEKDNFAESNNFMPGQTITIAFDITDSFWETALQASAPAGTTLIPTIHMWFDIVKDGQIVKSTIDRSYDTERLMHIRDNIYGATINLAQQLDDYTLGNGTSATAVGSSLRAYGMLHITNFKNADGTPGDMWWNNAQYIDYGAGSCLFNTLSSDGTIDPAFVGEDYTPAIYINNVHGYAAPCGKERSFDSITIRLNPYSVDWNEAYCYILNNRNSINYSAVGHKMTLADDGWWTYSFECLEGTTFYVGFQSSNSSSIYSSDISSNAYSESTCFEYVSNSLQATTCKNLLPDETNTYTIHVVTPGTLGMLLVNEMGDKSWADVLALKVSGSLNEADMAYFTRMTNLQQLDLSETNISSIGGCRDLAKLTAVLLPSTCTAINDDAFRGCKRLVSVNLNNIQSVGNYAFLQCFALTELDMPNVLSIGNYAFTASSDHPDYDDRYSMSLQTINMPVVQTIGNYAFCNNMGLSSITIPLVSSIGQSAFCNCYELVQVDLSNVTELGEYAFYMRNNRINNIQSGNLTQVTLSDELKSIPSSCFEGCEKLTSITFPNALKSIGYRALPYVVDVQLPTNVTSVGSGNFINATSITIPANITNWEAYSSSWKDVYCYVVVPPSFSVFNNSNAASATLHVPAISLAAYKLHDTWYQFGKIVPMEGELNALNLNSDFHINTTTGLANTIDMTLSYIAFSSSSSMPQAAHVNVNTPMILGNYEQNASTQYRNSYYYDPNGNYVSYYGYPYYTTLIPQETMSADSVTINLNIPTRQWQFISFPFDVNVSDIEVPEGVLWVIRKYSGADRAAMTGNTWQNMSDGSVLNAGEGYILHCTDNNSDSWSSGNITFTFKAVNNAQKNNIFAYQAVSKPLNEYVAEYAHNRSWNLVGNPYPAFYNTQSMDFGAPITVWNGNGYTAYSLLDDEYVLRPFEAFFVQRPVDAATITFQPEGRTHSSDFSYNNGYYAPRRIAVQSDRHVYNFTLSGYNYTDKARLVINESAQIEYEISCDASKMMSNNTNVPQLFIRENGIRMAINERPLANGEATLGIYVGQSGTYTLALQSNPTDEPVMLTDTKTNTIVDLSLGEYTFDVEAGTEESRFIIGIQRAPTIVTTLEKSIAETNEYAVYTMDGRILIHGNGAAISRQLGTGMYILRSQNNVNKMIVK